jgi:uncharacterized protein (TIGR02145 family)
METCIIKNISIGHYIMLISVMMFVLNSCDSEQANTQLNLNITTTPVNHVTSTTAISGAKFNYNQTQNIVAIGVCWSSVHIPRIYDDKTNQSIKSGNYTSSITGLKPYTTYYLRAYATNGESVYYGNLVQFKTSDPNFPVVTTSTVRYIGFYSAQASGDIISYGQYNITSKGICWSLNNNPTISDNKIDAGGDSMSFNINITNLTPDTKYYIRAYATNLTGTGYSEVRTFRTKWYMNDIDGNTYSTISIGNQIWMAANLKTTHFCNGDSIPNVRDNYQWTNSYTPAFCDYENNSSYSNDIYGHLYNVYVLKDSRKLCPSGWHVPADSEWTKLIDSIGGPTNGYKLKITGTTYWNSPNGDATNETGFSAVANGYRHSFFDYLHEMASWWSINTSYSAYSQKSVNLYKNNTSIYTQTTSDHYGHAVRCVKD